MKKTMAQLGTRGCQLLGPPLLALMVAGRCQRGRTVDICMAHPSVFKTEQVRRRRKCSVHPSADWAQHGSQLLPPLSPLWWHSLIAAKVAWSVAAAPRWKSAHATLLRTPLKLEPEPVLNGAATSHRFNQATWLEAGRKRLRFPYVQDCVHIFYINAGLSTVLIGTTSTIHTSDKQSTLCFPNNILH